MDGRALRPRSEGSSTPMIDHSASDKSPRPNAASKRQSDDVDVPAPTDSCYAAGRSTERKRSVCNDDHDDWARSGEERISGTRHRRERCHGAGEEAAPQADAAILLEAATLPDRGGGLRDRSSLGSHPCSDGPRSPPDTAIVRQGFRKAGQERCARCRSDLRSRAAANHAVSTGQDD